MNLESDFNPGITAVRQMEAVRAGIHENSGFSSHYVIMNSLSTIVACYGLLSNSTAVVIGAMIIALLLGPILGMALALVDGDTKLLRKSILAEIGGVCLVISIAFIVGKFHQDIPLTQELLARTSPNILDLMIALAGGAAGAFALVSPRLRVGLVGVAIATALVPPLATCGICLARAEHRLAFGGFTLFIANLVAIQTASSIVMLFHGYHDIAGQTPDWKTLLRRNALSALILTGLAVSLGTSFHNSIVKLQFESTVRRVLEKSLDTYPGVYLADLRFSQLDRTELVIAVVRTPNSFVPQRVKGLQDELRREAGEQIELHIRAVLTKESSPAGYLHELPEDSVELAIPELNQ